MSINNKGDFIKWEAATRDTIDLKRVYIDACGRLNSGVLLSQLIYYFLPVKNDDGSFRQHSKLFAWSGELWVPMRRSEWWGACRLTEDEVDTVLRECGVEMDADGRFKEPKLTRRRPKAESRNLIVYRSTLLENSNKKTHILRPNWPVFLEALDGLVNNYVVGGRDTPSPDEVEEPENNANSDIGENPISISDVDEEAQNRNSAKSDFDFGTSSKPISDTAPLPHIEGLSEGFKTSTLQAAIADDGDVDLNSSSSSPSQGTPAPATSSSSTEGITPPLPGLAAVSVPARPSGELTHIDGLAKRFSEWAASEEKDLDAEKVRRIITKSNVAASEVAELDAGDVVARFKDFRTMKLPERIFGKNYTLLTRDVEYLRWLMWLWPVHLAALAHEGNLNSVGLCHVFVHRAGYGKEGRGEIDIALPKVEWLNVLIAEDNRRLEAARKRADEAREAQERAEENARVEALNAEYRALPEEDRRALHAEVVANMPKAEQLLEAGFDNPSGAIMALMRNRLAAGWTSEQYRAAARYLAHDGPQRDIEAALSSLDPEKYAEIDDEARKATQSLNISEKMLDTILHTRRVSLLRAEIKTGRIKIPIDPNDKKEAA